MRLALKCHSESHCNAITRIEVEVARTQARSLTLHYFVLGEINDLRLPSVAAPKRADDLWRHTCFEAFIRTPPSATYYEFNVAPSKEWAAYRFDGYRRGMNIAKISISQIDIRADPDCFELKILLELGSLADLAGDAPWHLGLSAVIEEKEGNKSYWALAHPPGQPDFHQAECFTHEIRES